ncbi:tryptophan synthase beta subunit-like PLP-dependent enzyme [Corynespora cassiicola Philippines]|uniref:L-serine ammonia-lyase n=1 Tax=Corynespora cassiicola Philippines TaxID=1448308 RepID=A0A2T2NIU4_CORCC|nr:tryptophan synthase beta subunit-like PLP-dependent enzyme [Corynespora cassiicola Philippines]
MTVSESVIAAGEQQKPYVETPLVESYALSQAAGCRIFLKLENTQPSGSFKSRGIGHYILKRLAEIPADIVTPHIFASSGGNAGLAAVHASRSLGLPCTVVVPLSTKPLMVAKLRAAGAYEVLQHGATWKDADTFLRKEVMVKAGDAAIYTPPFDHPDIWEGNSTVMHELAAQMPGGAAPDVVICSVGGGGLLNGIGMALDDLGMSETTTVLATETDGAASLAAAIQARELVTLPEITTQATSLGCVRVTQRTLDYAMRPNVRSVVLSDAEAAMGCWRLADDERIMVEMACGINVALCYDGKLERALGRRVRPDDKVVIVLCGGSNVTVDMLAKWREEYSYVVEKKKGDFGNGVISVPSAVTIPA